MPVICGTCVITKRVSGGLATYLISVIKPGQTIFRQGVLLFCCHFEIISGQQFIAVNPNTIII